MIPFEPTPQAQNEKGINKPTQNKTKMKKEHKGNLSKY